MRIGIIAVGRMKAGPERDLIRRYADRAVVGGRALSLTGFETIEIAESRAAQPAARKAEEAKAIKAAIPEGAIVIALDEHGKSQTSLKLAEDIARWRDEGRKAIVFLIGGADGLDPALLEDAGRTIAFSALTWPHQLVRVMLAEQLYRATTIMGGHPYHRGD